MCSIVQQYMIFPMSFKCMRAFAWMIIGFSDCTNLALLVKWVSFSPQKESRQNWAHLKSNICFESCIMFSRKVCNDVQNAQFLWERGTSSLSGAALSPARGEDIPKRGGALKNFLLLQPYFAHTGRSQFRDQDIGALSRKLRASWEQVSWTVEKTPASYISTATWAKERQCFSVLFLWQLSATRAEFGNWMLLNEKWLWMQNPASRHASTFRRKYHPHVPSSTKCLRRVCCEDCLHNWSDDALPASQ